MDFAAVAAGMTALKAGLDTIKAAIGIVKDIRDVLPERQRKGSGSGARSTRRRDRWTRAKPQLRVPWVTPYTAVRFRPPRCLWSAISRFGT